jgi:hypothetical protein
MAEREGLLLSEAKASSKVASDKIYCELKFW